MAYSSDEIAYIKRLGNAGATPQQIFEKIKERRQKEKDLANPRQKGFMEIAKESVVDAAVNSPAVYIPKNIYSAGKKLVHDVKGAFSDEPYQVDENSGILGKVAGTLAG
jgi:dTDP-D-glucose 4,6-dehydratase